MKNVLRCPLLLGGQILLASCGDGALDTTAPPSNIDPNIPPVVQGSWYRPPVHVTWQWQLSGSINTAYAVDLYDIDLFDSPDAVFAELHNQGRSVICYFSAGSSEAWRPDFNRLDPADMGKTLDGFNDERWLDIRSENVLDIMLDRLDLAAQRGCDGVEPDNVDGYSNDTGFDLTATDQLAFNRTLANEAHQRGLSVALKNDGDQAADLVDYVDFELNEECHAFDECGQLQVFIQRGKPVLNVEYVSDAGGANALATTVCAAAQAAGLRTLILPLDLDDAFRVTCQD